MYILKPVTSITLAAAVGAEQIFGHGDEHVPKEGGAPEPHQVRQAIRRVNTTTTDTVIMFGQSQYGSTSARC